MSRLGYDYQFIIEISKSRDEDVRELGRLGYRLVHVINYSGVTKYIFEREL